MNNLCAMVVCPLVLRAALRKQRERPENLQVTAVSGERLKSEMPITRAR
jgi:hypothetical protein